MSKDAILAEILALPHEQQREIFLVLADRLHKDQLALSDEQIRELDRRIDRFESEGSSGELWESVYKEFSKAGIDAHHHH